MDRRYRYIKLFSGAAGLSDTLTGIGLVILPAVTLGLMGVDSGTSQLSLVRFIGAFVLGTGSLYLWALGIIRISRNMIALYYAWLATAWLRICVAVVTSILILQTGLTVDWWPVPATDAVIAVIQLGWIFTGRFAVHD